MEKDASGADGKHGSGCGTGWEGSDHARHKIMKLMIVSTTNMRVK
jgi:hypothetical protein